MLVIGAISSAGIVLAGLSLCGVYYIRQTDDRKKKQTKYILIGLGLPLIGGLLGNLFPISAGPTPELIIPSFAFSSLFISYGISKYQLFELTPSTATENILETMNDFLFLLTPEGTIQQVNQVAFDVLHYSKSELIGPPLTTIIIDDGQA